MIFDATVEESLNISKADFNLLKKLFFTFGFVFVLFELIVGEVDVAVVVLVDAIELVDADEGNCDFDLLAFGVMYWVLDDDNGLFGSI